MWKNLQQLKNNLEKKVLYFQIFSDVEHLTCVFPKTQAIEAISYLSSSFFR